MVLIVSKRKVPNWFVTSTLVSRVMGPLDEEGHQMRFGLSNTLAFLIGWCAEKPCLEAFVICPYRTGRSALR